MEKCINYQATALEIEQLIKNWIEISKYELMKFENYKIFEISANNQVLNIEIKELMDSITVIIRGNDLIVKEVAAYLNSHLPETASYEIQGNYDSEGNIESSQGEDLRKCAICGELQPKQLNLCLKCGAILE